MVKGFNPETQGRLHQNVDTLKKSRFSPRTVDIDMAQVKPNEDASVDAHKQVDKANENDTVSQVLKFVYILTTGPAHRTTVHPSDSLRDSLKQRERFQKEDEMEQELSTAFAKTTLANITSASTCAVCKRGKGAASSLQTPKGWSVQAHLLLLHHLPDSRLDSPQAQLWRQQEIRPRLFHLLLGPT